tara:strand:- start:4176 stop:6104 length:1929 start_codon:yes stop_codon:yes gene_type:complete
MAGTFFFNEADSTIFSAMERRKGLVGNKKMYPSSVIERNAWCKIWGKDGQVVFDPAAGGIFASGRSIGATYGRKGTGKPKPSLQSLEVTLEGTAGSLRRCSGKLICYDVESFNELEELLLVPKTEIKVQYGYSQPIDETDKSPMLEFTVYDYNFTLNEANNIEVGFKAVGKGQEILEANAFNQTNYGRLNPNGNEPPMFVADYNFSNEKRKVSSLLDALDYMVQYEVGALNTSGFEPKMNSGWKYNLKGEEGIDIVILEAPNDYDAPGKQKVGITTNDRITYYSLNFLAWVFKHYICHDEYLENGTEIICNGKVTRGRKGVNAWKTDVKSVSLCSGDPIMVMWVTGNKFWDNYSDGEDKSDGDNLRIDQIDSYGSCSIQGGDLSRIMVSRDCIVALMNKYREVDADGKNISKLPVKQFWGDIFATIKDCSGGGIDLFFFQNPEKGKENQMLVKNQGDPPDKKPNVVMFDPMPTDGKGDGITKKLTLTGKVPKGMQAEAFGSTPSGGDTGGPISGITEEDEDKDPPEGLQKRYVAAFENLAYNDFNAESCQGLKAVLKEIVSEEKPKEMAKNKAVPYPLEMECTLHGIYGFKFGDTVSSNHLPRRYKKESGFRIGFTVTGITDKIENDKWTTELKTTCRIVNN